MSQTAKAPIRFARAIAILWLANFIALLLLGGAHGIAELHRDRAASTAPTSANTESYVEHGQVRFAPPKIQTTIHRVDVTAIVMLGIFLILTVGAVAAAHWSDATGRR